MPRREWDDLDEKALREGLAIEQAVRFGCGKCRGLFGKGRRAGRARKIEAEEDRLCSLQYKDKRRK